MPAPELATQFLISLFGGGTTESVFLCSLPNDRGGSPGEKRLLTRDPAKVESFVAHWDQPGRSLYFCTGTILAGATPERRGGSPRNKSNVAETPIAWADIDYKGVIEDDPEALAAVQGLMHPPSAIVASGHGLHLYWLLREAVGPDERTRLETLLRSLCDLVAGDPQVCEAARLMRLPGSTNSKDPGEQIPVEIMAFDTERRYELADLEDMAATMAPILSRKPTAREAANPFLAVAQWYGFKPPVDIKQRLAAMRHHATDGESSIHATQLYVSAVLLNRGMPRDQVVALLLEATAAALGEEAKTWDWQREKRKLENMCDTWIPKSERAQEALAEQSEPEAATANGDNVVNLADRRSKAKAKTAGKPNIPRMIADGVVEHIRSLGLDILLTGGTSHLYRDGLWSPSTTADEQWLRVLIQDGFEQFGINGSTGALNATWKRLMEHPRLFERDVTWDPPSYIVVANGALKIRKGDSPPIDPMVVTFEPESPQFRVTRRMGAPYDPDASCPMFLDFLDNLFVDESEKARENLVGLLRQFFGASLCVNNMHREQRRALIVFGKSKSGKSALAKVFERLMGAGVVSHALTDINDKFGLEAFIGASAWVRDDAINEGDKIDAQKFKTLVTGEAISVRRMNRISLRTQVNIPILLTSNPLPRTTDLSDAVFNRSLLINLNHIFDPKAAVAERDRLGIAQGGELGDHLFDAEASGILNWALRGLELLLNTGYYDIPEEAEALLRQFKDDNNPVSAWARSNVVEKPFGKVARSDLLCAYHGWQREQEGDEARAMGGRAFFPRLRAICPFAGDAQSDDGTRHVTGIALTDEALQLWRRHYDNPLKSGTRGASLSTGEVNRAWAGRVGNEV